MAAIAGAGKPIAALRGVGARQAERLARLGIHRIQDLLLHRPLRYEDRSRLVPLGEARPGVSVLVQGRIEAAEVASGRRRRLICRISDGTGSLELLFFHFYASHRQRLRRGVWLRAFGEIRPGLAVAQMVHPEWEIVSASETGDAEAGLTPVYPTTEGLPQTTLRRLVEAALAHSADELPELLPEGLLVANGLPTLGQALETLHRPPVDIDSRSLLEGRHPAVRRLVFEELLAHRLSLLRRRQTHRSTYSAPALVGEGPLHRDFLGRLPFRLTAAQRRVAAEVAGDIATRQPMLRLIQGDVGSGKTVVAALAALGAVEAGWQAAIMAPTELLAEQHLRSFREWFAPLGVETAWFSSRLLGAGRREAAARLRGGEIQVAIGTHALFQQDVRFARLGLVVVDEQHRFGVHQRLALRDKGEGEAVQPHQLVMTATPIPRTLAMTAYADLDVSVIDEFPPGRKPVTTVAVPDNRREEVLERVRWACAAGRQAYWVCTLVEASDALEAEAAEATATLLRESLPNLNVGLVHGRLRGSDKEAVMAAFEAGEFNLLVATTVIEVGVDVPNASLMIVENPERLGLAQLHQLRGRVGRGGTESSCVLLYRGPLTDAARARLGVLRDTNDGFRIAERDLDLRGPGELLGTRQTGALLYRVADLARDADLLGSVRREAQRLLDAHPARADALVARWVGEGERYAQV